MCVRYFWIYNISYYICYLLYSFIVFIVTGALQGVILALYLFIICQDFVLRTSIDTMKVNGFKLAKERSRKYPVQTITDADYADDRALLANTPTQAETLLHRLERAAAGVSLHLNAHKTEYMSFNQRNIISTPTGSFSETSEHVYLPRKQCLINWKRNQHVISKGMESYQ